MAFFYHSLISRLFGDEPEKATEVEPEQKAPPAEPPPSLPRDLRFPPAHAIHQLWKARVEGTGWLPEPDVSLTEQAGLPPLISDPEVQKELVRLQMTVNSTANKRLTQVHPPKRSEDTPIPDLDAEVIVFVAGSGLAAWLMVYPPVGQGAEVNREMLDKALKNSHVQFGVDTSLLEKLPQKPDRYFHMFPCARGKPVVHGVDGRVTDFFPRVLERKVTVDENNRVDYTSLNVIHNIEAGEAICKLVLPVEGEDGRTVLDAAIPAKLGKPAALPKGRHTEISEDGMTLLASIAGHVEFSGRNFQVKPLLNIPGNVDFSTGDINFLGDVCIKGDICSGFTVRAMGSITVGGVVEACTVEAGGDLVVTGGVQGDNQAVIRAQRNIFAKFIENACVYAKESICSDCLINCDLYCDGGVEVRTGRMTVIGGRVRAAYEVSAGTIGSRAECRTEVILGGQPCGDFEYAILLQEIEAQQKELEKLDRQPDSPNKLSRMSKTRVQLMVNRKKLDQIEKERAQMDVEPEEKQIPRRMVCDTVYPGTTLIIDGSTPYRFDNRTVSCSAALVDGEISLM